MSEPRMPNLFIIGAPKCGTTSLSHYLAGHPHIFMSEQAGIKEPNYFNDEAALAPNTKKIRHRDEYLEIFQNAPKEVRYLGEASPLYLYSKHAVPRILDAQEKAVFIVCLRNPVHLAQSLHNQRAKNGIENCDFEAAWKLQNSRKKNNNLPKKFESGDALQYGKIAKTGEQMKHLLGQVPRDNVHIVFFEDLISDTKAVYNSILHWLRLEPDDRTDFPRMNVRTEYRWVRLERLLEKVRDMRQRLGLPGGLGVHNAINGFNAVNRIKSISPELEKEMISYFRTDVELLEHLTNRRLAHWKRPTKVT